jgi:putative cardiolipin synthase
MFGSDRGLAAIDAHPHVQVRIFNPWSQRSGGPVGRVVEFLGRMNRLNSRMHNKLIVADGRMAICGGRNVGDAYFGLSEKSNFHDLDLLAVGPVARDLSAVFDLYWNSEPVVAGGRLEEGDTEELDRLRHKSRHELRASPRLSRFPVERADWSDRLRELPARLLGGTAQPVYDAPRVGGAPELGSITGLRRAVRGAQETILFENAYWVPDQGEMDFLNEYAGRGVRIRIVTNSLGSHDVPAVNGAFKKWRRAVVESGTELYELRHDAALKALQDTPPVESRFLGLHTKAFVVDGEIVYVGSHNLDPRSHEINTELGLLVESRDLAEALTQLIERDLRGENSWRVRLDDDGELFWQAGETRVTRQPARNGWQRVQDAVFGILPIEDQL